MQGDKVLELNIFYSQDFYFIHYSVIRLYHLAKSLATVSLGQVTKAAECVPDVYVSDAMENALSPTVLSSWNINTLRSTVWEEKRERRGG